MRVSGFRLVKTTHKERGLARLIWTHWNIELAQLRCRPSVVLHQRPLHRPPKVVLLFPAPSHWLFVPLKQLVSSGWPHFEIVCEDTLRLLELGRGEGEARVFVLAHLLQLNRQNTVSPCQCTAVAVQICTQCSEGASAYLSDVCTELLYERLLSRIVGVYSLLKVRLPRAARRFITAKMGKILQQADGLPASCGLPLQTCCR